MGNEVKGSFSDNADTAFLGMLKLAFNIQPGTGSGTGIDLTDRSNVTIKNMEIKAFWTGIWLDDSSKISIYGNNLTGNHYGIYMSEYCSNNTISGDTFYLYEA